MESPAVGREEPGADRAGPPSSESAPSAPQDADVEQAHGSDAHTDAQAQAPSASAIEASFHDCVIDVRLGLTGVQRSPPDAPATPSNPIAPLPATAAAAPSTLPSSFAIPVVSPGPAIPAPFHVAPADTVRATDVPPVF